MGWFAFVTAACCLVVVLVVPPTSGRLASLETTRFPPPQGNLLSLPPSLQSLSSHAKLGSRGTFRYKNGDFHTTAMGGKRVRLVQTFAGYDVFGPSVVAEADENEMFTGEMIGDIATSLSKEIRFPDACKRSVKTFQNVAIRLEGLKPSDPNIMNRDGRRIVYANPKAIRSRLAYKVEFFYSKDSVVKRPIYIMEACTGLILLRYNNIHNSSIPEHRQLEQELEQQLEQQIEQQLEPKLETEAVDQGANASMAIIFRRRLGICSPYINGKGGNAKTGKRTYNLAPLCLKMEKSGAICRMQGTYVKVVDNQNSQQSNKQDVVSFPCALGYKDGVNGAHGVANDALFYGEASGRFFQEKYNMRALPYLPRMVVHYGQNVDNAFWDRTDMFFGDGRYVFHPLVALDVIAHELAHGVTSRNSDLVYAQQSGGINEAFSDITGEATKHFLLGKNDWNVGSTIFKSNGALRYFKNPPQDGRSIKYAWKYRPLMDVHYSSGVFNHAFYLLVTWERMNIFEAYKCFLDANLNLWGRFTNYYTGACNVMQAAYDNGFNYRKVRRAFRGVGIPLFLCRYWRQRITLRPGETRSQIFLKDSRSPIFKVDASSSAIKPTGVRASSEDASPVKIVVASDRDAEKVIATGENEVNFDPIGHSEVFVKLMSNQTAEVKTVVTVL